MLMKTQGKFQNIEFWGARQRPDRGPGGNGMGMGFPYFPGGAAGGFLLSRSVQ